MIVTCRRHVMIVFLPEEESDYTFSKGNLVSLLKEKVEGLEEKVATLKWIREDEILILMLEKILADPHPVLWESTSGQPLENNDSEQTQCWYLLIERTRTQMLNLGDCQGLK